MVSSYLGLNLPRQQESVYHALSSLSCLRKLRHLNLNLPLTSTELPREDDIHWNPISGLPAPLIRPQPAPQISADYCKETFNYMLRGQEKSPD